MIKRKKQETDRLVLVDMREELPDGTKRTAGRYEVTAAEAATLVNEGKAKYVDASPAPQPADAEQPSEENREELETEDNG